MCFFCISHGIVAEYVIAAIYSFKLTVTVVMELPDPLWMNCKSESGSREVAIFFSKRLIKFVKNENKHGIFMSYNYQH